MAVTDQQIRAVLAANPNASPERIMKALNRYGIAPERFERVTGMSLGMGSLPAPSGAQSTAQNMADRYNQIAQQASVATPAQPSASPSAMQAAQAMVNQYAQTAGQQASSATSAPSAQSTPITQAVLRNIADQYSRRATTPTVQQPAIPVPALPVQQATPVPSGSVAPPSTSIPQATITGSPNISVNERFDEPAIRPSQEDLTLTGLG